MLCRYGHETMARRPRITWCYMKRRSVLCTRFCNRCYEYFSQLAEQEHKMKRQAMKDTKAKYVPLSLPFHITSQCNAMHTCTAIRIGIVVILPMPIPMPMSPIHAMVPFS